MVKLLEKGDLYLKTAKVSKLLLLCAVARAVARDVREKERIRFIVNLVKLEEAL